MTLVLTVQDIFGLVLFSGMTVVLVAAYLWDRLG